MPAVKTGRAVIAAAGRLEALAALLLLAGLVIFARSAGRLAGAVRARNTLGAPYRRGQIADRLFALAMTLPVLMAGVLLAFLAVAQSAFQPGETTVRVGRVEAHRSGAGTVAVRFTPGPLYPADGVLEGEVKGRLWALAGDFIDWDPGVRWLGLRRGHRLRYLLGSPDAAGLSTEAATVRALETLPWAARELLRIQPYVPFLTVRRDSSPWFRPAGRHVMDLYAVWPGYLAESVSSEVPGPARDGTGPRGAASSPDASVDTRGAAR